MKLENHQITYHFRDEDGVLDSVVYQGKELLCDDVIAKGMCLSFDLSTADIWESRPDAPHLKTVTAVGNPAEMVLSISDVNSVLTIHREMTVADGQNVLVRQQFRLSAANTLLFCDTTVENQTKGVLVSAETNPFEGIIDRDWTLMWPFCEGELHEHAFQMPCEEKHCGYPMTLSMQWLTLFGNGTALYYAVEDPEAVKKQFTFRTKGEMTATQYPFLAPGERYDFPTTVLGPLAGDWHVAADVYREYVIREIGWPEKRRKMAKEFRAIRPKGMSFYRNRFEACYCDGASCGDVPTLKDLAKHGIETYDADLLYILGWHADGFDTKYPDYRFSEKMGGEDGIRQGFREIHEVGGHVMPYVNTHIGDREGEWYNALNEQGIKNGVACAQRKGDGTTFTEQYDTAPGLVFDAMCPCASAYADRLVETVEKLRAMGADAVYLDQMMAMPAEFCYNRDHGHKTPATAYCEGYHRLVKRVDDVMRKYGEDYLIGSEGVCDAYMRYVDYAATVWDRHPGRFPENHQEIARYTLPLMMLGLRGWEEPPEGIMGMAFVHFMIFDGLIPNGELIRRYVKLYRLYGDLYSEGRFVDALGIMGYPKTVSCGMMLSADNKRAAIHFFNHSTEACAFSLKLTLSQAGANGVIRSIVDPESGERYEHDTLLLQLTGKETRALLVELS